MCYHEPPPPRLCLAPDALGMSNEACVIYQWVIDHVAAHALVDLKPYGVEEALVKTLKGRWEQKLADTGVVTSASFATLPGAAPLDLAHDEAKPKRARKRTRQERDKEVRNG